MFIDGGAYLSPEDQARAVLLGRTAPFGPFPGEGELMGQLARSFVVTGAPVLEIEGPTFIAFCERLAPWFHADRGTSAARSLASRFGPKKFGPFRPVSRAVFPRPSEQHTALARAFLDSIGLEPGPVRLRIAANRVAAFLALGGTVEAIATEAFLAAAFLIDDWADHCQAPGRGLRADIVVSSRIKWWLPSRNKWNFRRTY